MRNYFMNLIFFITSSIIFLNSAFAAERNLDNPKDNFGLRSLSFPSIPEEKFGLYGYYAEHKVPQGDSFFESLSYVLEPTWKVVLDQKAYETLETDELIKNPFQIINEKLWEKFKKINIFIAVNNLNKDIINIIKVFYFSNLNPALQHELQIVRKLETFTAPFIIRAVEEACFEGFFIFKRTDIYNASGNFLIIRSDKNWFALLKSQIDWW